MLALANIIDDNYANKTIYLPIPIIIGSDKYSFCAGYRKTATL